VAVRTACEAGFHVEGGAASRAGLLGAQGKLPPGIDARARRLAIRLSQGGLRFDLVAHIKAPGTFHAGRPAALAVCGAGRTARGAGSGRRPDAR